MPRAPMPGTPVLFDAFPLRGGLDLHTPQLSLPPGVARAAENFECSINGGYTRIPGYERFDGRVSPSDASYLTMTLASLGTIAVGDAINGQTSGATGTVAAVDADTNLVVYTKAVGSFLLAENVRKAAVVQGAVTELNTEVTDDTTRATYTLAAANIYRSDIGVVPGSGPVRGLVSYGGSIYAFRNNAGGTAVDIYRSTSGGWIAVTLTQYELRFTAGNGAIPAEGASITQGGVSAVVRRVVVESGSFTGGTAAGRFIINAPTGGSFAAGVFTAGVTATASGAQTAITLAPGGRFELVVGNAGNGSRIYGCDGVNRGFEFDGSVLVPIVSGQSTDVPSHVAVHKRHLFFSFATSAQHSGTATPYMWTAVSGAAELGVGSTITAFLVLPGDSQSAALAILTSDATSILYGTSAADWNLVDMNSGVGAKAYSAQALTSSYVFDDLGVVELEAVQQFGNFASNALTVNLRQFTQARRTLVTASLVNREKSQYRIFFSDGYGLYCTIINGRFAGAMPVSFPNAVNVTCAGESTTGNERSYFGSTNGYVYRLDVGTSFDGAAIQFACELAFASQGNARMRKRYRKAVFELQGDGYGEFTAGYTLGWETDQLGTAVATNTTATYWDDFTWDEFTWDGRILAPSYLSMDGSGENVSMRIAGESALWPQFTLNSVILHYTPRRILR